MSAIQLPAAKKVSVKSAPRTKEVKQASKPAEVITAKVEKNWVYEGQGKSLVKISTAKLQTVAAQELITSDRNWHTFAIGILAGKLDKEIIQAVMVDKKNKPKGTQASAIRDIFKGVEKSRLAALKEVLTCERAALANAWYSYINQAKQKSPVSVYGLHNALRWMAKEQAGGNTKEKARPIKDALKGVVNGMRQDELLKLPAALYDLLAEYELLPEVEEVQAPAPKAKAKAKKKTVADIVDEMEVDELLAA